MSSVNGASIQINKCSYASRYLIILMKSTRNAPNSYILADTQSKLDFGSHHYWSGVSTSSFVWLFHLARNDCQLLLFSSGNLGTVFYSQGKSYLLCKFKVQIGIEMKHKYDFQSSCIDAFVYTHNSAIAWRLKNTLHHKSLRKSVPAKWSNELNDNILNNNSLKIHY